LTALRVSHDSSDRNLSSSVETYPLNQGQISIFTEEVLKLAMTKGTDYRLGAIQYSHRDIQARKNGLPGTDSTKRSNGGTTAFPSAGSS